MLLAYWEGMVQNENVKRRKVSLYRKIRSNIQLCQEKDAENHNGLSKKMPLVPQRGIIIPSKLIEILYIELRII